MSEKNNLPSIYTIGAFGFTESEFFKTLQEAGIDTFCDIRRRRGVRGSEYAFVNAARLLNSLAALGIRYHHFVDLSPTDDLRALQSAEDSATKTAKRQRTVLGESFKDAYEKQMLADFDANAFLKGLGHGARKIVLFCVEREPAACHRSLLAAKLEKDLAVKVTHLVP